jgi:hypothetical protein
MFNNQRNQIDDKETQRVVDYIYPADDDLDT